MDTVESLVNFDHLDHLLEVVEKDGERLGIVHIYSEAPEYGWVHDDDEGAAAVDDAARAAIVYLRHFELTGDTASRDKAEALVRFIAYMQNEDGLFYNFVWDSDLTINEDHQNSRADQLSWWTARSVWALGRCAEVFQHTNPVLSKLCAERVRKTYPNLASLLSRYGETFTTNGREYPNWLIYESASDATSELMLGLAAMHRAFADSATHSMIERFGEGIRMMQYGDIDQFPYSAHASWIETWHAWGNAQTQALSQVGELESAKAEANSFYPRLLIEGWLHSLDFVKPDTARRFEQIAYGVRGVALGLLELHSATQDDRYAKLAGLAASWFTGNNVAGTAMYDPGTGRGYDGIQGPNEVNFNAGAESTIEALYTLLEIEQRPQARAWLFAKAEPPEVKERDGTHYLYRVFYKSEDSSDNVDEPIRLVLVINLTDQTLSILEGRQLDAFLDK